MRFLWGGWQSAAALLLRPVPPFPFPKNVKLLLQPRRLWSNNLTFLGKGKGGTGHAE